MGIIPVGTNDILTDRLLLRKFTIEDAYHMFTNWASNPHVTKYLDWTPHKDINETKAVIKKWLAAYNSGFYFNWAITLRENNIPIGAIGLSLVDINNKSGEIGFCLGENYWNQKYTTEALGFCLHYLFNTANFKEIKAKIDEMNIYSKKILQSFGFNFSSGEYILKCESFEN